MLLDGKSEKVWNQVRNMALLAVAIKIALLRRKHVLMCFIFADDERIGRLLCCEIHGQDAKRASLQLHRE
jgi:hypothetical protein